MAIHTPNLERVKGFEPSSSAWKAEVLPLNYTRNSVLAFGGGGRIRTSEAEAADLQSAPFDRSGTPPKQAANYLTSNPLVSTPLKNRL